MARAEYTTGYPCDAPFCDAAAGHQIHREGHGYLKFCNQHAAEILDREPTETPKGGEIT